MDDDRCYHLVKGLRAVRSFRPDPIDEHHVHLLLEAARWTGSSKNLQRWSFVVLRDPERRHELASAGQYSDPLRAAPMVVALVEEPGGYEFDTGRIAQNLMLAAAAMGIASCPVTLHDDTRAGEILGLHDGARCRYAIALGHAEHADDRPPVPYGGRKPLTDLVHWERYSAS